MKIKKLVNIEFYKILKRKESILLIGMIILPLLYGFGFKSGSSSFQYNGNGRIACLDWVQIMCNMMSQVSIFYIFMSIISVRSLSNEIEDSSIHLYIHRVNSRKKIYRSKFFALLTYLFISFTIFIMGSVLCYFTLMKDVTNISSNKFWADAYSAECIMIIIEMFISFVFMISLSLLLSTYFKPLVCVAITLLEHIVSLFVSQLSYVCYISPWFYYNRLLDNITADENSVGNTKLAFFSDNNLIIFTSCIVIYVIFIAGMNYLGEKKFVEEDL